MVKITIIRRSFSTFSGSGSVILSFAHNYSICGKKCFSFGQTIGFYFTSAPFLFRLRSSFCSAHTPLQRFIYQVFYCSQGFSGHFWHLPLSLFDRFYYCLSLLLLSEKDVHFPTVSCREFSQTKFPVLLTFLPSF